MVPQGDRSERRVHRANVLAPRMLADAERLGIELASSVGVEGIAGLRALPPADLIALQGQDLVRFIPIVDGHVLVEDPLRPAPLARPLTCAAIPAGRRPCGPGTRHRTASAR